MLRVTRGNTTRQLKCSFFALSSGASMHEAERIGFTSSRLGAPALPPPNHGNSAREILLLAMQVGSSALI